MAALTEQVEAVAAKVGGWLAVCAAAVGVGGRGRGDGSVCGCWCWCCRCCWWRWSGSRWNGGREAGVRVRQGARAVMLLASKPSRMLRPQSLQACSAGPACLLLLLLALLRSLPPSLPTFSIPAFLAEVGHSPTLITPCV